MLNPWIVGTIVYVAALAVTLIPVFRALLRKVELGPPGAGFDDSPHFSADAKVLLNQHYSRIRGALGYWKNQAALYKSLHFYSVLWTIPSAVVIPILTQAIGTDSWSKTTVTLLATVTAILLALHKGLKVEDNLKAYRHGESEFYDLVRRLLDRPEAYGRDEVTQLSAYFDEVERVRRFVRNAETNNLATVDEARTQLDKLRLKHDRAAD
jgi:hypothetical protein